MAHSIWPYMDDFFAPGRTSIFAYAAHCDAQWGDFYVDSATSANYSQPQMSLERAKRAEDRAASETVGRLLKNTRQAENKTKHKKHTKRSLQKVTLQKNTSTVIRGKK